MLHNMRLGYKQRKITELIPSINIECSFLQLHYFQETSFSAESFFVINMEILFMYLFFNIFLAIYMQVHKILNNRYLATFMQFTICSDGKQLYRTEIIINSLTSSGFTLRYDLPK